MRLMRRRACLLGFFGRGCWSSLTAMAVWTGSRWGLLDLVFAAGVPDWERVIAGLVVGVLR